MGDGLYRAMSFPELLSLFSGSSKQSCRTIPIQPSVRLNSSIISLVIATALSTMLLSRTVNIQ